MRCTIDFRLVNAFVQMRVNSQPLSYALDRASISLDRWTSKYGNLNVNMRFRGMQALGNTMQGLVTSSGKYVSNLGKSTAAAARTARIQSRMYHDENVQNRRRQLMTAQGRQATALTRQRAADARELIAAARAAAAPTAANMAAAAAAADALRRANAAASRATRARGRASTAYVTATGRAATARIGRGLLMVGEAAGYTVKHLANLSTSIIKTINPLGLLGNAVDGAFHGFVGLVNAGKNLGLMFIDIGGKAGIGLAAIIGVSLKAAGDQEAAMVNIGRVANMSGKELDSLKNKLLSLAAVSAGASLKDINEIAEFGARLGIGDQLEGMAKSDALARFTKDVSKLRLALDDIPADEAATKIVRILKVFGESPDAIPNFASALVRLDNASTATGRDILELTRRLSGITSAMGMLPEDVMAIASSMRDVGIEVHVGGTALQQLFLKMGSSSQTFSKQLGINAQDLKHAMDTSPVDALRMVIGRLSQYRPRAQMEILTNLHMQGRQSASTLFQLAKAFKTLDSSIAMSRQSWQTMADVEDAVNLRSQTAWAKLHLLGNQVLVLGENVGVRLLPAFKEFIMMLGDIVNKFKDFYNSMSGPIDKFIQHLVRGIQTIRAMIDNLPAAFDILQEFISIFVQKLQLSFIGMGPRIIDTLGDVFKKIGEILKGIAPFLLQIAMSLGEIIGEGIFIGMRAAFGKDNGLLKFLGIDLRTPMEKWQDDMNKANAELMNAGKIARDEWRIESQGGVDVPVQKTPAEKAADQARLQTARDKMKQVTALKPGSPTMDAPLQGMEKWIHDFMNRPNADVKKFIEEQGRELDLQWGDAVDMMDRLRSIWKMSQPKLMGKTETVNGKPVDMSARYRDIDIKKDIDLNGKKMPAKDFARAMGLSDKVDIKNTPEIRKKITDMVMAGDEKRDEIARKLNPGILNPQPRFRRNMPQGRQQQKLAEQRARNADIAQEREQHRDEVKDRVRRGERPKMEQVMEDKLIELEMAKDPNILAEEARDRVRRGRINRVPKGGMQGLEVPDHSDYKPQFFGLEEFSKHLQTSLFDPKKQNETEEHKWNKQNQENITSMDARLREIKGLDDQIAVNTKKIADNGVGVLVT